MPEATTKPDAAKTPTVKLEQVKELKLPTIVLAADLDPSGQLAYAACFDGGIHEVELESGKLRQLAKHQSYASGVRKLKKLEQVISAGYDGKLRWTDAKTGKEIRVLNAHKFWSWQMEVSADEKWVASCTGQYLAGGYKYEPAPEQEPSIKVYNSEIGELRHEFSHLPPVLSVAFSPDNQFLAAGNMMGDVKVWDLNTGKMVSSWNTPDFTSWGIIKSHHYIGGIYDLTFTPKGDEVIVCGMGPMRDPMAGNGEQRWQRFAWKENPPRKVGQIKDDERGNGLMEALQFHPSKPWFVMAGRLAQGKWNAALFDDSGSLLHQVDTKMRITDTVFFTDGERVLLAGGTSQERKKDDKYPEFGRLKIFRLSNKA